MTRIQCCRCKYIALMEYSRCRINGGLVLCTVGTLCPLPHQAAHSCAPALLSRRDEVARFTKLIPGDMCSL
jgi:hypothetical protein